DGIRAPRPGRARQAREGVMGGCVRWSVVVVALGLWGCGGHGRGRGDDTGGADADAISVLDTGDDGDAAPDGVPDAEPDAEPDPDAAADADPDGDTTPDGDADPDADPDADADLDTTPSNAAPTVGSVTVVGGSACRDFTCVVADVSDPDGDAVTVHFRW